MTALRQTTNEPTAQEKAPMITVTDEPRRPTTKRKRGPYIVAIETAVGWSKSRNHFQRLRQAKKSALWFASLQGVWQARVIDLDEAGGSPQLVATYPNTNRKPR